MSYLIFSDFKMQIQSDNLLQIVGQNLSILEKAKLAAQEEAQSYLIQKYDTDSEFTDTTLYSVIKTYNAADRVYLDATAYSSLVNYALGTLVLQAGNVYKCITAIIAPEVFTLSKWLILGAQYDIFHVGFPKDVFNYKAIYKTGDQVFWKNKTYTALLGSILVDHDERIQQNEATFPNVLNIFPDNPSGGDKYWGAGVTYTKAVDKLPSEWIASDNRSQQMLMTVIDIALYHVHKRIAPRNIPDLRVKAYDDAISWLKRTAKGDITAKLTYKQPIQGTSIRYNSVQKQQNGY